MANITLDARQQQKHDTSTNFNNANKLYLEGEFLVETDTGKVKIGDGTLGYKSLPYTIGTRVPEGAKFTDTTYTAGTGLSLNGTSFSISNSGVTAGSYGPSQDSSVGFGDSIDVPYISVNSMGQITSADSRSITLPSEPTPTSIGAEPAFAKNTAFNKNFGSAAGTVCQGNDSRLSNARPASDVSAWAKEPNKPTYTPTEVGVIGTAPTSGQVAVFDGTTGKIKSTGFTIASSVPSGAKFTDTTYSKATDSSLGLVQVGYTTSDKNYAVSLDTDGNAYVNVPWENTTYTNGDGLSLSDGMFSIEDTGVVASLYGPGGDSSPLFGGTFMVPYLAVNSKGQILTATNRRIKIPSNTFVGASTASGGTSGLVPAPNAGQSTRYLCSDGEWSIPTGSIYKGSTAISVKPSTTDGEYNIYLVALFPGTTSQSVGPSASGTINFGSAFNVPYITIDQYGRITALANRSMILSGALASSSAPGLCPKLDSSHPSYYLNANGNWSLPRGRVYGVKGEAETDYREGQVNITAANIGALSLSSGGTVAGATTFSSDVTISGELNYDGGFY